MKLAFIDCSTAGISGNTLLAALLDAGANERKVKTAMMVAGKPFSGVRVEIKKVSVSGIGATRVVVKTKDHGGRKYVEIVQKLKKLELPASVKKAAMRTLETLARAEAVVHEEKLSQLTFHKLGAADAVADIVGCCTAANELGLFDCRVLASEVAVGRGVVSTGHGLVPLPAPATLEILKGVPMCGKSVKAELTTPTGAALLKTLVDDFVDAFPAMKVRTIGYGTGTQKLEIPNLLRVTLGEASTRSRR